MSAVEALAEVLREHRVGMAHMVDERDLDDSGWLTTCNLELRCPCGEKIKTAEGAHPSVWALHEAHVLSVLVAAIRSMPAEQVAELIDGEVERRVNDYEPGALLRISRRVVTPWLPLGVSPETNGEQK